MAVACCGVCYTAPLAHAAVTTDNNEQVDKNLRPILHPKRFLVGMTPGTLSAKARRTFIAHWRFAHV